ncbi:DNA repair protein RAD5B [Neltuma alba]|uniref:DNA repair protein RAD5B n=1 Tax=Neltuma alba TaxID=207710 RepID=UPI0010A2DCED|nr:DNA repair protein RAD5B [Prosopis alba]
MMEVDSLPESIKKVQSRFSFEVPEPAVRLALTESWFDVDAAVEFLNNNPGFLARPVTVVRAATSTGSRVLAPTPIKQEGFDDSVMSNGMSLKSEVKEEPVHLAIDNQNPVKAENGSDDSHEVTRPLEDLNVKKEAKEEINVEPEMQVSVEEKVDVDVSRSLMTQTQMQGSTGTRKSSWEAGYEEFLKATDAKVMSKEEYLKSIEEQQPSVPVERSKAMQDLASVNKVSEKKEVAIPDNDEVKILKEVGSFPCFQKSSQVKKEKVEPRPANVEDGDFPGEPDWFLVGRTIITALSTTKGRKLVDNEIVHFDFRSAFAKQNSKWILRISTKRSGEVGRVPMEWAKEVVPLVRSARIKVRGRCVAAPPVLQMMQDVLVCVSFYVHHSAFTSEVNTSWKLDGSTYIDPSVYPLPAVFKLIGMKPYQNAAFTPEELDSRKRLFSIRGNTDEAASDLPVLKRRKGCPPDQDDEQAVSQSSLNKLVGASEVYDLEEMEGPSTLMCDLKPYQKQALYWMSELEKGTNAQNAENTLHPCWAAYRIDDMTAPIIYVNNFTGEATTKLPPAFRLPRGGILADAMGLGKTVMTIALILARQGRGDNAGLSRKRGQVSHSDPAFKVDGGTLVVCPMALLGQWKDELEIHSKPGSLSIFVHYGGDRTNDPRVISAHDVVLTTYRVLGDAYKTYGENSIYHRVNWHRVVLDEAHSIKAHKSYPAQASFTLTSHCRWCLTGTPLQNSLEDLFSLLCFLHVQPWGNFAWFNKLVQRPCENGDPRGLKLVKAILKPLMLRRTKETKDKCGRPILVLPPAHTELVECEQSAAEAELYNALFRKSKHQFDQYVGQGNVLSNYANILGLLLRLRQCCNHPFLITSRSDSKKPVDFDILAKRLLDFNSNSTNQRAYVIEAIEALRKGEKLDCPICLESADDPVFAPCAHRMCRECLFSSWSTQISGPCPICRQMLNRTDLINCPFENQFLVSDVEKDWKESTKVSELLKNLEDIRQNRPAEKSIVFSQWTAFLDLLEIALKKKGIGYFRFDGSLQQKNRERVLKEFNESSSKRVLLMSLKAGGVGLNLTAASNVFIMDPWWNPAVEEQAVMRIHRIGQKRTVMVKRFIVKDTVEERLQQVQAKKQKMISGALTDDEVRSTRIEDLMMLFS